MTGSIINRRSILTGAATGGAVLATAGSTVVAIAAPSAPTTGVDGVCFLNPDVVDGPYYVDEAIMRRDVTEGKKGIPLEIRVRIVDGSCRPISGARIDTWQADAGGIYSNFRNQGDDLTIATIGQSYLRGTQISDDNGQVVFTSIYPGWYRGRTPHVHFKIYIGGRTRLTGQLFFPDALNEFIYGNVEGYKRPLVRDTINATDWILADATYHAMADVREELDRYVATIIFGVNPGAVPPPPEKMPCPPAPKLCVPEPGVPPVGPARVAELVPSDAALKRPRAQKPPLPV